MGKKRSPSNIKHSRSDAVESTSFMFMDVSKGKSVPYSDNTPKNVITSSFQMAKNTTTRIV